MAFHLNLEQLRKQAKGRVRERRRAGQEAKLAGAQFEIAREHGFVSWSKLKEYVERLALEQPFREDLDYYEGRANGIASVMGVSVADARAATWQRDTASRAGPGSAGTSRRCEAGAEPPTPFVLAYRAIEANDRQRLDELLDRFPDLAVAARNERQRPAGNGRRPGDRVAPARARRRPEPRQRLRLDEAAPGRLLERLRPRQADARRRRAHRSLRPRRRRHAARRRALLGPSGGRRAARTRTR